MPHRVFTLAQAADYLHLSKADVERFVRERAIPFEMQGGRTTFRKTDLDAWASQRILNFSTQRLTAYHKKTSAKAHDLSKRHAIVTELIRKENIEPALNSRTRASVIRDVAGLAEKTGLVSDARDLVRSLEDREQLGTTALAGGVALLHPRHHEPYMFSDSFIIVARTVQPVPFSSPDGSTTDIFFLICCQDDRIHLHVLARIAMLCHYTSLLFELREAEDAAGMLKAIVEAEAEVVKGL